MKQRLILLHAAACISLAGAGEPLVFAYYYPWYVAEDWSRHAYVGTPLLGTYGTDSPKTAEQHVTWCADNGIDGLFVSWWGADHLAAHHLDRGLLKATNLDRVQFALFYESLGLLDRQDGLEDGVVDFSSPKVMAALVADFRHLKQRYFHHPQYLELDGRPVVGLYVTRTFKGFTRQHLDDLRKAIDTEVYLIADEAFFGKQAAPESARNDGTVFDAYTAYNMFENARVREGDSALSYQAREAFPVFRAWARQVTFIPAVFPSYADFRGNKPLPGTPADFATLLDAAASIGERRPSPAPRMVLLTSFNEWWEGTTIEPTEEYGRAYLDVIRRFTARPE